MICFQGQGQEYTVKLLDAEGVEFAGASFPALTDADAEEEARALLLQHERASIARIRCKADGRVWDRALVHFYGVEVELTEGEPELLGELARGIGKATAADALKHAAQVLVDGCCRPRSWERDVVRKLFGPEGLKHADAYLDKLHKG